METAKPTPAPVDKRTRQQKHFDDLYEVFYTFYQEKLALNPPPHERVRLVLTTRFFDDLELQKRINPIFAEFVSNPDEKRCVAMAAYFDALTIHNRLAGMVFKDASEKEKHDL